MWRRAVALVLVCGVLAIATTSAELHAGLIKVLEAARDIMTRHPVGGALLFMLLCALSAMFAFFSVSFIVPFAFYVWGLPITMILMWSGWVAGGVSAYLVARCTGRAVMRWLGLQTALGRLERLINSDTSFGLILLFQLAMPSEIPGYVLGLARYSLWKYAFALMIAEIPIAAATAMLGANFVQRQGAMVMVIGSALVLTSVMLFYLLRSRLDRSMKTHAPDAPGQRLITRV